MDFSRDPEVEHVRGEVRRICERFPVQYWNGLEPDTYPTEFVDELTKAGWLSALIPTEYGGGGASLALAATILEEINSTGCNSAACHAQMYTMGMLLRHGSEHQRQHYLPRIASGELRLQAFAVTEPTAGSDTTQISTTATRTETGYRINGQKVFISRALHSDLMILLARTGSSPDTSTRSTEGLSAFLVDLREQRPGLLIRPISTMMNHGSCEIFFDDYPIPDTALIGDEGSGFRYILDGWNAERVLIASECIGDGRWFVGQAAKYATDRAVFGQPIGANQGVQFPIARAYADVEAAVLVRDRAAWLYDRGLSCGAEANMAKLLASDASWAAANAALDAFGGWGFATELGVERKFRETRLYQTAPVNNNLVLAYLANHVLGMPKSY